MIRIAPSGRVVAAGLAFALLSGQGAAFAQTPGQSQAQPQAQRPMRVLITNDDGIDADGLKALVEAFKPVATVVVAAPAQNRSGAGQSVSFLSGKLRVEERASADGVKRYAVHGTPADSAIFGLKGLGAEKPFDLVVSGINKGENVGEAVFLSGTVGAARQAAMMGVPAIAVSRFYRPDVQMDYTLAARYTARLATELYQRSPKQPYVLSVNVPAAPKGVKLVPAGGKAFALKGFQAGAAAADGGVEYMPLLDLPPANQPGTDAGELANGFITVSLIDMDGNAKVGIEQIVTPEIAALP